MLPHSGRADLTAGQGAGGAVQDEGPAGIVLKEGIAETECGCTD
jgi:hypothetical protein